MLASAAFSDSSAKYMLTCMKFIVYDTLSVNPRLEACHGSDQYTNASMFPALQCCTAPKSSTSTYIKHAQSTNAHNLTYSGVARSGRRKTRLHAAFGGLLEMCFAV